MNQPKHKSLAGVLLPLLLAISACTARADEGMWMTGSLPAQAYQQMRALGLRLSPEQIYSPDGSGLQGAVVMFGGYCTGVVVSPQGLLFTNHHCGFESIQRHSTPQHDYLRDGFYAPTQADEWPVPGLYVSFPVRAENVTARVVPLLCDTDSVGVVGQVWGARRAAVIDSLQTAMESEVQAADSTLRAELVQYFGGNDFYLNVYRDYNDVRLVLAPPASAGKFGGETDNWTWPRETCDFSVFRIYSAPDGSPAAYSSANVPFRPKRYAPISLKGYADGSYAMTIGFPGRTYRYLSSWGISERMAAINEPVIQVRTLKQNIWREQMDKNPVIRLKYDNKYANSANYWKNSIGMNRSLRQYRVVEQKREFENTLAQWIASDTLASRSYSTLLSSLRSAYDSIMTPARNAMFAYESFGSSCDMVALSSDIDHAMSDEGSADSALVAEACEVYRNFDSDLDRRTLAALMLNYSKQVPADQLPSVFNEVANKFGGNFSAYVDRIWRQSVLPDSARTLALLRKGRLKAFKSDALFRLADGLRHHVDWALSKVKMNPVREQERRLQQAVREMYARSALYPDANFTVRLSYGKLCSYDPRPGVTYPLFTTPQSLHAKVAQQSANSEYFMEPALDSLLMSGDYGRYADPASRTLQLCFISDNDITGGNSGSPVFNADGELMGLAFDGNWESMANDIKYSPDFTRCISVDIRYVLFLIDRWAGASRLVDELDLRH